MNSKQASKGSPFYLPKHMAALDPGSGANAKPEQAAATQKGEVVQVWVVAFQVGEAVVAEHVLLVPSAHAEWVGCVATCVGVVVEWWW